MENGCSLFVFSSMHSLKNEKLFANHLIVGEGKRSFWGG